MFGKGISRAGDILDLAAGIDLVKKSGAWYAYEGEKIGQGRENAKAYLESHPEVMEELDRKVRAHYHLPGADGSPDAGSSSDRKDADKKSLKDPVKTEAKAAAASEPAGDLKLKADKA